MSEFRPPHTVSGMGTVVLRLVLILFGALLILGGCMLGAFLAVRAAEADGDAALLLNRSLTAAGVFTLGIFLGLLLIAASAALGILSRGFHRLASPQPPADDIRPALGRLEQSLRMLNTLQAPDASRAAPLPANAGLLTPLLEQIRDFSLMSDDQRRRFAQRHWLRRRDAVTELIEREVLVGDWATAFARLDDLQLLLPDDPNVHELRTSVDAEQATRLQEDLKSARNQLIHLIGTTAWPQAETLVSELQRKYSNRPEPAQLAEDLRRQREAWDRENAERLFKDIASASEKRQWNAAVLALQEFVRRYPDDPRASALRLDLPTLLENAAAHERKEQEEHFKDLLKHQRYTEAIAVARSVLQKYPNSPAATELNKLLPRVEELAKQQAAAYVATAATAGATAPTA